MATADRVNLIEEFESQKDNNFIFLTTFSFNPTFFDTFLLDKIRLNNPYAEVFVLIDSNTYHSKYDEFTSRTGTDYHLLPVDVENGFFHPKVHMFLSETDEIATVYAGSANLTLQGMTNNLESVVKLEHDLREDLSPVLESITDFFHNVSDQLTDDLEYQAALNDLASTHFMGHDTKDNSDTRFLTNHHTPILNQIITEIPATEFEELVLAAPFVSRSPNVVGELTEEFHIDKTTLMLQKGNHNLEAIDDYRELAENLDIEFDLRELVVDKGRFLHAKLIIFKGDPSYLLIGSPNLTKAALLSDWDTGNVETSLLLSGPNLDILDEFETSPVENEEEFLAETAPDLGTGQTNALPVYTAKFSSPTNELLLRTAERPGKGEVTIKTRDPSEEKVESIELSRPENKLRIERGIPTEVMVSFDDEEGRRRVFHDKDRIFKRAKRTSITLQEISDSFDERAEVDLTDLVFVFQSLNENLDRITGEKDGGDESSNGGSSSGGRKSQEEFRPPSRGGGSTSGIDSPLRKLTHTYESVRAEKKRQAELEETYTGKEDVDYLSTQRTSISELEKVESQVKSFIRKSNRLLQQFSEESEEPAETWLEGQHILFRSFVMLVGNLGVSEELYDYFEEKMHENLEVFEGIKETEIDFSESVKKRFFTYMLVYNILNRNVRQEDFKPRPRLMRPMYSSNELMNKQRYEAVKEEVESNVELHLEDVSFEFGQFRDAYASLITKSMGPKTVQDDVIGVCKKMMKEPDDEFKAVGAAVLFRISDNYSISSGMKKRLRKLDPAEDDMAKEAIDHLLQS